MKSARWSLMVIAVQALFAPVQAGVLSETVLDKPPFEEIDRDDRGAPKVFVSPDGTQVAYWICDNGFQLSINGQVRGQGVIREIVFSPDGKRFAFQRLATTGLDTDVPGERTEIRKRGVLCGEMFDNGVVVLDGKQRWQYKGVGEGSLVFSQDGKRFVFQAVKTSGKWVNVVDGAEGPEFESLLAFPPVLSRDGKRLAFAIAKGTKKHWVVDGVEQKGYIGLGGLLYFSPDGKRTAYAAVKGDHKIAVIDGLEAAKGYDGMSRFVFSPDGKRVAYDADLGETSRIVLDGTEGPAYGWVSQAVFSADGKRAAYVAHKDGTPVIVADGKESAAGGRVVCMNDAFVAFSPDGRHLAHVTADDSTGKGRGRLQLRVDGKPVGGGYGTDAGVQSDLVYSPDGKHTAFLARDNSGSDSVLAVVVDGEPRVRPAYYGVVSQESGKIWFDGPSTFHYVALNQSNEVVLVKESVE